MVAQVEAKDADSGSFGKITYLLDRTSSNGKFSVDPETGKISVAEPLDREEQASYALVLQAFDNFRYGYATGESRNAFKQITVNILDTNDQVPKFLEDEASREDSCNSVTEFHEDVIMTIRAKDGRKNKIIIQYHSPSIYLYNWPIHVAIFFHSCKCLQKITIDVMRFFKKARKEISNCFQLNENLERVKT